MNTEDIFNKMKESIISGNKDQAAELARDAVENNMDLLEVIEKGYTPGIQKVGDLWEQGEYFLPELITSAECMKAAMEVFTPELEKANLTARSLGKVVIGTVEGDIHDIGKSLVASMLSANGFDVVDLGADVNLEKFIQTAEEEKADLICLSALLTTTMLGQRNLIEMLKEKGLSDQYKVMVGGSPVNQKWADDIHANGYAENALRAVSKAKELMEKK